MLKFKVKIQTKTLIAQIMLLDTLNITNICNIMIKQRKVWKGN